MPPPNFPSVYEEFLLKGDVNEPGPLGNCTKVVIQYSNIVSAPVRVVNITLSVIATTVAAICFARRLPRLIRWRTYGIGRWILLLIYIIAWLAFLMATIARNGLGSYRSAKYCDEQFLFSLVFFGSVDPLVYFYFIERCYVINSHMVKRWQSPLYIGNLILILGPYAFLFTLQLHYRQAFIKDAMCYQRRERFAVLTMASFRIIVLAYLTGLFLYPLIKKKMFSSSQPSSKRRTALRRLAMRTFVASCVILIADTTQAIAETILNGEPGWLLLNTNTAEALVTVMILHWLTSVNSSDEPAIHSSSDPTDKSFGGSPRPPTNSSRSHTFRAAGGPITDNSQSQYSGDEDNKDPERAFSLGSKTITTVCSHDPTNAFRMPNARHNSISVVTTHSHQSEPQESPSALRANAPPLPQADPPPPQVHIPAAPVLPFASAPIGLARGSPLHDHPVPPSWLTQDPMEDPRPLSYQPRGSFHAQRKQRSGSLGYARHRPSVSMPEVETAAFPMPPAALRRSLSHRSKPATSSLKPSNKLPSMWTLRDGDEGLTGEMF
ncbi:hypothetical protein BT63DRAFT_477239 [Microthyrium microscopicum]|uniref:Uncharacterized protein n=1 Tax=Microthyrium microscopicum TaxID=703497 RepID=A0A6A6ULC3_9PEZI|nr:hypothetical protein BT63DRAFT_477239 [Microthyrium microscopicum]